MHPSSTKLLVAAGDKWGRVGLWVRLAPRPTPKPNQNVDANPNPNPNSNPNPNPNSTPKPDPNPNPNQDVDAGEDAPVATFEPHSRPVGG